jgi:hypothetical protein
MGGSPPDILSTPFGHGQHPTRSRVCKLRGFFALALAAAAGVFFCGKSVRFATEEYGGVRWPIDRRVEYILRSAPLIGEFGS